MARFREIKPKQNNTSVFISDNNHGASMMETPLDLYDTVPTQVQSIIQILESNDKNNTIFQSEMRKLNNTSAFENPPTNKSVESSVGRTKKSIKQGSLS